MQIKIEKELNKLAEIFAKNKATLYIVGGYVRNALMGFCETDTDICSSLTAQQVTQILKNTDYTVKLINPQLGTLHISIKGSLVEYEHTTFRCEKYLEGGNHSPNEVTFVQDMSIDASRRDFTCNCIYYNILNGEFYDKYNGIQDIKDKIIKTVETPEFVFSRDGLRILRMVRMASELDFCIEQECYKTAQNMISQLRDISQERFNKEIISIIFADYKYNTIVNPDAPLRALNIMSDLKSWQYLLPALVSIYGKSINNLSANWLHHFAVAKPEVRIASLVLDMATALGVVADKEFALLILGQQGFMFNKKDALFQAELIKAYTELMQKDFNDLAIRHYIQKHYSRLNLILSLLGNSEIAVYLSNTYRLMKTDNVPFEVAQLQINGNDLIEYFPDLPKSRYSAILKEVLFATASFPELNTKQKLIDYIKKSQDKMTSIS